MSNVAEVTTTEKGNAFAPVTEHIHHHGKEPEAPAPTTIEELEDELGYIAGDLTEIACILELLAERTGNDPLSGFLWGLAGVASRADSRLSEAVDALYNGHTENVGLRIDDGETMALHLNNALHLAWETEEAGGATSEMRSGTFAVASNAADYVQQRLGFLLYESDLSYLDD